MCTARPQRPPTSEDEGSVTRLRPLRLIGLGVDPQRDHLVVVDDAGVVVPPRVADVDGRAFVELVREVDGTVLGVAAADLPE